MTFKEIYNSIKGAFEPQNRSTLELGIILNEINKLSKHPRFNALSDNQEIGTNTTIARLLRETEIVKIQDGGSYFISSEAIERAISLIYTFKIFSYAPDRTEIENIETSGQISALKKYFIQTVREALVFTRKKILTDELLNIPSRNEKLNFLNSNLISIKQSQNVWDDYQFTQIIEFIELELQKVSLMVDDSNSKKYFEDCDELNNYLIEIIESNLIHNIKFDEGFRVFWRDKKCDTTPKHETEIQPYIKSILKPYCDQKNIKISRESSIANGSIDLTFTYLSFSVCLEIKKANHLDILTALKTQLTQYMYGEKTKFGIYLILWLKNKTNFRRPIQFATLNDLIDSIEIPNSEMNYKVLGVDCTKPLSPSKRKT